MYYVKRWRVRVSRYITVFICKACALGTGGACETSPHTCDSMIVNNLIRVE